jgi:precorrin-2 methylase
MDILQYISKLKNPQNTERRICKIINLMLTDSLDLFNKLNNSQKKVIMNSHRDIQKLDKIKNTNFNCSNEQLIKKIFNRYKDIYRFHKQNIQITEYKQPESFIPLETTIEPSIQRPKSITVSKCQSIVQLWLDRNVKDKQNIREEEIKILTDKNITIPQLNECLIYLGHPTVQVSSVTTSNYNPEIIDSSLSEQPETARPPLLIKPETPSKRSVSGIIPILKKNGVTKQAAELALSEELNAALVEYKREEELLIGLQEKVKEAGKKLEEAIVNKYPTLQNIYDEYLEEANRSNDYWYLKRKVKELKEISPDEFNSYITTLGLMIESMEKLRKALINKNPGYGDSLDRILFL